MNMRVRGGKPTSPTATSSGKSGESEIDFDQGESKKPGHSWSSAEYTMIGICVLMILLFSVIPTPERNFALVKREQVPHPYPLFSPEQMEDRSKNTIKTIAWAVTISKGFHC